MECKECGRELQERKIEVLDGDEVIEEIDYYECPKDGNLYFQNADGDLDVALNKGEIPELFYAHKHYGRYGGW